MKQFWQRSQPPLKPSQIVFDQVCANCSTQASSDSSLMACARCKSAFYCSCSCQRAQWKAGHKNLRRSLRRIVGASYKMPVSPVLVGGHWKTGRRYVCASRWAVVGAARLLARNGAIMNYCCCCARVADTSLRHLSCVIRGVAATWIAKRMFLVKYTPSPYIWLMS